MAELDLNAERLRMQRRGEPPAVVGEAVLRNYPLRLWVREQEYFDAVLREFQLLLDGRESGAASSVPQQLVDVAEMFTTVFGSLIEGVFTARQQAVEAGLDRMDSHVPLVHRTPDYLDQYQLVLRAVDDYCRSGDLLTTPRPPEIVALMDWTLSDLTAQYYGAPPAPWAGPF